MLWNAKVGGEFGPKYRALRRLPIRRDLYEDAAMLGLMVDQEALPYEAAEAFTYDGSLTGHLFSPLRMIVRVMCIDSHQEMKAAWEALTEAGFPAEASAKFFQVTAAGYEEAEKVIRPTQKAGDKVAEVRLMNRLATYFRENYREAERLARAGR